MIGHFKLKNGFILLFLSCIWSTAQAQSGTRYAFVNMEYIFSCIPDYAKAQQELDDYSQKLQADIDAVYAEIAEMQSRYNADKVFNVKRCGCFIQKQDRAVFQDSAGY